MPFIDEQQHNVDARTQDKPVCPPQYTKILDLHCVPKKTVVPNFGDNFVKS